VLSLPGKLANHNLLVVLTFGVVLFTVLAQGLTIGPLVQRLGLAERESTAHDSGLQEEELAH
jgi:CPA1 family monovalent cation:H+ antiporter